MNFCIKLLVLSDSVWFDSSGTLTVVLRAFFISCCKKFCPPIAIFSIVGVLKPFASSCMNLCLLQCALATLFMFWVVVNVGFASCLVSAPLFVHSISRNPFVSVSCMKVAHSLHAITWYASLSLFVEEHPVHCFVLGIVCCLSFCILFCCFILLVINCRSSNGVVIVLASMSSGHFSVYGFMFVCWICVGSPHV